MSLILEGHEFISCTNYYMTLQISLIDWLLKKNYNVIILRNLLVPRILSLPSSRKEEVGLWEQRW